MAKSTKKAAPKKAAVKEIKNPKNPKNIKEAEKTSEKTSEPVSNVQAVVGPEDMQKLTAASVTQSEATKEEEEVKQETTQETADEESTENPADEGTAEADKAAEPSKEQDETKPEKVDVVGCPVPSYPTDRYGFTIDIRKAVSKGVSKAKIHNGRHEVLLETLREALAFAEKALAYSKGRK